MEPKFMQIPAIFQENVALKDFTTYKIGGKARYFAEIDSIESLQEVLRFCAQTQTEYFTIGKGSNLVVSDQGFDGAILYIGPKCFGQIDIQGNCVTAQAGVLLHSVVGKTVKAGLAGMENLGGIPGTMGGGAYINAGAFDQELVQVITEVKSLTPQGELRIRNNEECGFSYRRSNFFDWDEIIVEVTMELRPENSETLTEQMNAILKRRKEKQPLNYPNAGSMYKRPPGTYAGKLIQEAELKGFKMGGAQISPKHANFVINTGEATAQDIYDLSTEVILRVAADSGITMEREQIFLGEFLEWPRS